MGSDGVNTNTAASLDYNGRTLVQLPVTTSRWRFRVRNASGLSGTAYAGAFDFTGVWIGTPLYSATGIPWGRTFASAPSQAVPAFSTPADGSEYLTDWVTDPALQFQKGVPLGVSYGMTRGPSGTFVYSTQGWTFGGVGAAAGAGSAAPAVAGLSNFVVLDTRIEYEYDTASGPAGVPVGVCIGDSITSGWSSDTSTPAGTPPLMSGYDPHTTWPGAAGLRNGFAWVNMGIGSTQAGGSFNWSSLGGWRWDRCDIDTTVPDFAILALGTNDVNAARSLAQIQADIQTVITFLRGKGIQEIYLGTIVPRNYATPADDAKQAVQDSVNAWMRNMPSGVAGVFDFEKALQVQAAPRTMDAAYVGSIGYPHPNRAGYQKMAAEVARKAR